MLPRGNPPICHLGTLNDALAIKLWDPQLIHQLLHLFCDNKVVVIIFQAGSGKDPFLKDCAMAIWQTCTQWDTTLVFRHILGASLQDTADTISRYNLGPTYRDRVSSLLKDKGIYLHPVPGHLFTLSDDV